MATFQFYSKINLINLKNFLSIRVFLTITLYSIYQLNIKMIKPEFLIKIILKLFMIRI